MKKLSFFAAREPNFDSKERGPEIQIRTVSPSATRIQYNRSESPTGGRRPGSLESNMHYARVQGSEQAENSNKEQRWGEEEANNPYKAEQLRYSG